MKAPDTSRPTTVVHGSNVGYGLGLIGSAVYYVQHAAGAGAIILGLLKALVWPAFVVYDVLKFIS